MVNKKLFLVLRLIQHMIHVATLDTHKTTVNPMDPRLITAKWHKIHLPTQQEIMDMETMVSVKCAFHLTHQHTSSHTSLTDSYSQGYNGAQSGYY